MCSDNLDLFKLLTTSTRVDCIKTKIRRLDMH
uniref:Uncharacterized protein n=1 Tax=Rhizophora mucronata TaxID=61149 RepID=A0A2P2PFU4_RHIMU